jgi:hypothetical protein
MRLRNFTPHSVAVYSADLKSVILDIPPEKKSIRVKEVIVEEDGETILGIPILTKRITGIDNLPEPEQDTALIVSLYVFEASDRKDLLCPDTGEESVVRDEYGQILGVRRFCKKA